MKDYYLILGVPRGASPREIRQAYRRRVKELHPDAAGGACDTAAFCEVTEAYETLARPERRRAYDALLAGRPSRPQARRTPVAATAAGGLDLAVEVLLSPREARRGGVFPLRLPVAGPCPFCEGMPPFPGFCPGCAGAGFREAVLEVDLVVPPGAAASARLAFDLAPWGFPGGRLAVFLRTDPRVPD
ncbi:MAG: DnaJ domain-containing protein [Desulfobacterales bacterium]